MTTASLGWIMNFAAAAACGALFGPGAFQQSGWLMATSVAFAAFFFSSVSFVAYARLSEVASAIVCAARDGRISAGDGPLVETPWRCRKPLRQLRWLATPMHNSDTTGAAAPTTKKKKEKPVTPTLLVVKTPEAGFVVDVFAGIPLFTWMFECTQLLQLTCGLVLKMASAIDLLSMFLLENSTATDALTASALEFLTPLMTLESISGIVFLLLLGFCLAPSSSIVGRVVKTSDTLMLLLHLVLGAFLFKHVALRQEQHEGSGAEKQRYGSRMTDDFFEAQHLSHTYDIHQRIFFSCAAILTSFLPHCNTPSIFRECAQEPNVKSSSTTTVQSTAAVQRQHTQALLQLRAMAIQLAYFMFLGTMVDCVLPLGRSTSRLAVFNFVDYRTWLPNAEEDAHVMVLFALVPLVHLISAARGATEGIIGLVLRIVPALQRALESLRVPRRLVVAIVGLLTLRLSITWRPLYWLIFSNCLIHLTYVMLYLFCVAPQLRLVGDAKLSSQRPAAQRPTKSLQTLVMQLIASGYLPQSTIAVTQSSSFWWRLLASRASLLAAAAFWGLCLLYWIS